MLEVINENTISEIADFVLKHHYENNTENAELNILLNEKKDIQLQLDNIMKAIAAGIITLTTKNKLEELEKTLLQTDAAIELLQAKEKLKLTKADIIQYLKIVLRKEPYQMLRTLLKKVVLYDDKIEIFFNYTKSFNPDDNSQGFLFITKQKTIKYVVLNFPNLQETKMLVKIYF